MLQQLIDERHAKFNGTLYQLEPDTKDAPGALRDLLAVRTIARLTDPALLGHGPADPARLDEAEDFLLRVRSIVHLERKRNQNVLSHELQEKAAHAARVCRRPAAAAGRAADGRLLPARADRQPVARMGAQDGAAARRRQPGAVARRHPLRRRAARRPRAAHLDRGVSGGARPRHRRRRRSAGAHPAARRSVRGRGLLPDDQPSATRCSPS